MSAPVGPLRAVVVGAGLMGRWHADAIAHAGGRVAAVVDTDIGRARALAARHGGALVTADLESAAREASPAVAHLCTPLETHQPLASIAVALGLHVVVEKPMAPSASTTQSLLALAEAGGVLIVPTHQFLFQRGALRAQRALASLGPVHHVDAVACSAGADGGSDADRDRVASEILPHPLALTTRILARPLAEASWQVQHPAAGELRASAAVGASSVSILISMRGRPTRNTLRITAERATVHLDLFHGFAVFEGGAVSRGRKILHPFALSGRTLLAAGTNLAARALRAESAYPGLRELVRRFYEAVRRGGESPITARETVDVAAARDAIVARW